jgi:hypothetical protein
MPVLVNVQVDTRSLKNTLNIMTIKLPREVAEAGMDLMYDMETRLRLEVAKGGTERSITGPLIWRGKLWAGIQARKLSRNRSALFMPIHGIYLDRMKPHWVKLKRGRLVRRWAQEKGNARVQAVAQREGSIYVKPHPFIEVPVANSIIRFPQILRHRVDRAMRASKGG